ncbi:unnamed protein product [Ilex paraguariensis]|uniref:Uncharacterized protein n=1 Tax=Ilex paraguariensis TaxID=185542 RepID=A0ABC8UD25_9AQUA
MTDKVMSTGKEGVKCNGKGEMNPYEGEFGAEAWPGFKKKAGSVITAQKKLVKTMMAEYIIESIDSAIDKVKNKKKIKPDDHGSA